MGITRSAGVEGCVKREGKDIYVRGTIFTSWANPFSPKDAREIAAAIIAKADEADRPEFEPGKAYVDADGLVLIRNLANDGWIDVYGDFEDDDYAEHPVVKLVPETEAK